jgi:hypothetical protein
MDAAAVPTDIRCQLAQLIRLSQSPADALPPIVDWTSLAVLARTDGVTPSLLEAVRGRSDVPPAVIAALEAECNSILAANVLLLADLESILQGLSSASVPVLLLKGTSLLRHHGWSPALRPMSDLDLIVQLQQLDAAEATLHGLRFVSEECDAGPGRSMFRPGRRPCRVELHTQVYLYGRTRGEDAGLWSRAVPVADAPQGTLAPSLEDELHYLAFHLAIHHWGTGLKWQMDIARLLLQYRGAVRWDDLLSAATRCRTGLALAASLRAASALGGPVPAEVTRALNAYRPGAGERVFFAMASDDRMTWHARRLATAPSVGGLSARMAYLCGRLSPRYAASCEGGPNANRSPRGGAVRRLLSLCGSGARAAVLALRAICRRT